MHPDDLETVWWAKTVEYFGSNWFTTRSRKYAKQFSLRPSKTDRVLKHRNHTQGRLNKSTSSKGFSACSLPKTTSRIERHQHESPPGGAFVYPILRCSLLQHHHARKAPCYQLSRFLIFAHDARLRNLVLVLRLLNTVRGAEKHFGHPQPDERSNL